MRATSLILCVWTCACLCGSGLHVCVCKHEHALACMFMRRAEVKLPSDFFFFLLRQGSTLAWSSPSRLGWLTSRPQKLA